MKTLQYLLIICTLTIATAAISQAKFKTAEDKEEFEHINVTEPYEFKSTFHSTSAILMADTQLGLAEGGAFTTGISTGKPLSFTGPRRVGEDEGFEEEDEKEPASPGEPFPIGDGVWALLLMAAGYLIHRVRTRRREVMA